MSEPVTLSMAWGVDAEILDKAGVIDVTLNCDTNLFIDPLLLDEASDTDFRACATRAYEQRFSQLIDLLVASKREGDVAWRAAERHLSFHEIPFTHLGYSSGTSGSGFGSKLSGHLLVVAKEVVDLGVVNPDLFMALALFEGGIGADRISDMTTNIVVDCLARFTHVVATSLGRALAPFTLAGIAYKLPPNPMNAKEPLLLVPKDIVRDLPIAADWDAIASAAQETQDLKDRVNQHVGELWRARTVREKNEVLKTAMSSKKSFDFLLDLVRSAVDEPYDVRSDHRGEIYPAEIRKQIAQREPLDLVQYAGRALTLDEVDAVVVAIIAQFKRLIEDKGLWRECWNPGHSVARLEKAMQRLFYAVATSYCDANGLDISPESDGGSGPVDFKISAGSNSKVLVELKRSKNSNLVGAYTEQLDAYLRAEGALRAHYLIVDVGNLTPARIAGLSTARNAILNTGKPVPSWVVVDAMPQASASRR
jgi:hypothetical protein